MSEELGPESRALFAAARSGLGPNEAAVHRMRARIASTVAGGAIGVAAANAHAAAATTATTATAATATTAAAATGGTLAVKIAIVATIAAAASGTTAVVVHHRAAPPVRAPIVELPANPPSSLVERAELAPVAIAPAREAAPPPPSAPPPVHVAAPRPQPISLARETELVDAALTAMSHGQLADALAAIERYDAATAGKGQLAEDAAAIETEARCRLDDPRAAETLATFEARWPTSREGVRLRATCAPHE